MLHRFPKRIILSIIAVLAAIFVYPKITYAILPGCPPNTPACNPTTPGGENPPEEDGTENQGGETQPPTQSGDTPSTPADGTSPSGSSPQSSSSPGGTPAGDGSRSVPSTSGITPEDTSSNNFSGGRGSSGGVAALYELPYIIKDSLGKGEISFVSPVPSPLQCELISRGSFYINGFLRYDDDEDGLAQQPKSEFFEALMQEDYYKTDPKNPDTDYDSYFDGEEVCSGFDPLEPPIISPVDTALQKRLKGYILLQTERHGEAWYMYPKDGLRYYLRNGFVAYQIMKFLSLGITDKDLEKIPVGHESRFQDTDSDADGLPDKTEEGLKTDPLNPDTDGDGVSDSEEVLVKNTHPLGARKLPYDNNLVNRLKGKILLQVESRGQAWYVNPKDGKRYYMKDGNSAYMIMRFLSLGITNSDINKLPMGTMRGKIK